MSDLATLYPALAYVQPALVSLGATATLMVAPAGAVLFEENQPCQGFPMVLADEHIHISDSVALRALAVGVTNG